MISKKTKRKDIMLKAKELDDVLYKISSKKLMQIIIEPSLVFATINLLYLFFNKNYDNIINHLWFFNFISVIIILFSFFKANKARKYILDGMAKKKKPKVADKEKFDFDFLKFSVSLLMSLNMMIIITFLLELIFYFIMKDCLVFIFNIQLCFVSINTILLFYVSKENKRAKLNMIQ